MSDKPSIAILERPDLNCIFVRWRGPFSAAGIRAQLQKVTERELYQAGAMMFSDLRLHDVRASAQEWRAYAESPPFPSRFRDQRKVALLADSDLAFGSARLIASVRSSPQIEFQVFRTFEEGRDWLGLPADMADPFPGIAFPDDDAGDGNAGPQQSSDIKET